MNPNIFSARSKQQKRRRELEEEEEEEEEEDPGEGTSRPNQRRSKPIKVG